MFLIHCGLGSSLCHCGWWKIKWPYKYLTSPIATSWSVMIHVMNNWGQIIPYGRAHIRCWVVSLPLPSRCHQHTSFYWNHMKDFTLYNSHTSSHTLPSPAMGQDQLCFLLHIGAVPGPQSSHPCETGFPPQSLKICLGFYFTLPLCPHLWIWSENTGINQCGYGLWLHPLSFSYNRDKIWSTYFSPVSYFLILIVCWEWINLNSVILN